MIVPQPELPSPAPAAEAPVTIPLTQLARGRCAVVHDTTLCSSEQAMLGAMGLRQLCRVRVCRGGSHCCIVQVDSTRLALSPPVAARIFVRPEGVDRSEK